MSTLIKRNGAWYRIKDTVTGLEYYRSVPVYTGKRWIDGRPIYSLAIHVDNVPSGSASNIFDTGLGENVKDCIRLEAVLQGVDGHGTSYIESLGTPTGYDARNNYIWFFKKSANPSVVPAGAIRAVATLGYSKTGAPNSKIILQMEFTLITDTADTIFTKAIKRSGVFNKSNNTLIKHNGMWVNVYQYAELYQFKLNEEVYTGSHWLDGKPIYVKVIKGKTSSATTENPHMVNAYPADIASNFKDMVDIWGVLQNADNDPNKTSTIALQIAGEVAAGDTKGSLCWYNSTTDNIYLRGKGGHGDCDAYVTLFYTKQTDTAKPVTNVRDMCSTEEIFTGRYWLDGKKIYRKCYNTLLSGGDSSIPGTNTIPTGLPVNTIKNLIRCRAIANRCDNNDVFILACGGLDVTTAVASMKFCVTWYSSQSNAIASTGFNAYANKQQMLTIEYTKEE